MPKKGTKKEIPTSVSVITKIADETSECSLVGHFDHSHEIVYASCEVIPTEYFLREFAGPFEKVRTDLEQLQTDRDELRAQIDQTQDALENIPQKIAECLEKSLSAEAPFFKEMRELKDEHVKAVDQHIQGLKADLSALNAELGNLKRQSDGLTERLPELDALKKELEDLKRKTKDFADLSAKIKTRMDSFSGISDDLKALQRDVQNQKGEIDMSASGAAVPEEWRRKADEKLHSLEDAVTQLRNGTPIPPSPAQERGLLRRFCDFFRRRQICKR